MKNIAIFLILKGEEKVCQVEVFKIREKGELGEQYKKNDHSLKSKEFNNGIPGFSYIV